MAKKKDSGQMALFTESQMEVIEQQLERVSVVGGVKVTWSKAEDKRLFGLFVTMVVHALSAPITLQRGQGWVTDDVVRRREFDVFMERFLRIKRWVDELKRETEEAQSKEDLQEAYARLLGLKKDAETRLTNAEVCLVLMECSLEGPLDRGAAEEYKRAFSHVFGIDKYMEIWSTNTWPDPIRIGELEMARYNGLISRRFPRLDDLERAWIADFNSQVKAKTEGQCWPGTERTVLVGQDEVAEPATKEGQ